MIPAINGRQRILVVDAKQMVADRVAAFLRHNGYESKAAYSVGEALALSRFWPPDLILADVSQPGSEVVESALGLCTAIPDCQLVLMYTDEADVALIQHYKNTGENFEMIHTPVDPQELLLFVSRLVEDKAA